MRWHSCLWALALILLPGCAAAPAAPPPTAAPRVIVVTVTPERTRVPTVVRAEPTIPPATEAPQPSLTDGDACQAALLRQYTAASDHCLAGEGGTICNGGPVLEDSLPQGSLSAPGGVISASRIDRLQTPPTSSDGDIGLVWLHLAQEHQVDALVVGGIELRDLSSDDEPWRALTVESGESADGCESAPRIGALALQSRYGRTARLQINGLDTVIDGTLIVLTQAQTSHFIVIEGSVRLRLRARALELVVGTQTSVAYETGDWNAPRDLPAEPQLLDYERIAKLPIELLARPVPIPQPGYAQTQGGVNMRAAPDLSGRLLYTVPAGQTMSVLGISRNSEWLHIRLGNGEMGWMSAGLLAKNLGEIAHVYDEAPPPPQRLGIHANRALVNVPAGGNLRAAPDTAFRVLRTLPLGAEVTLLARSPYSAWVKVQSGDAIGWMALFTLRTKSVISSLPIDYYAPLPPRPTSTPSFSFGGGHAYPDPSGGY